MHTAAQRSQNRRTTLAADTGAYVGDACPYLGVYTDPRTHYAFPSQANCCHTHEPALLIDLDYQARYCLSERWSSCPLYQTARRQGVSRSKMRNGRGWLMVAGMVTAAAVLALVLLRLWWLSDRQPAVQATVPEGINATASPQSTAPAIGEGAASATPTVTPSATRTPTPGHEGATGAPALVPSATEPQSTAAPAASATPTLLPPTATLTPTTLPATPTPTSTAPPNPPTPTATNPPPTWTPTAVPPSPTPEPSATPTAPTASYGAPVLVSPADGQSFGPSDTVSLMWAGVDELDPNAFYAVTVEYAHQDQTWYDETPRLRTTRWELSEHSYLLDLSTDGRFRWWVQVMRQVGVDGSGNPIVVEASPPSIPRTLFWRAPDDPAANTPVPPPA